MPKPAPKFPALVAGDADLAIATNRISTSLSAAVNASDTLIYLTSLAGVERYNILSIDSERVLVTSSVISNPLTVVRAFDNSTAAPHANKAKVDGFVDAWHHNSLVSEVEAIETYLASSPTISTSSNYDFPAQTPGGSLVIGANSIILNPLPAGITAASINKAYLWISGGTGTDEAIPIIGLAGSTIIVTCAQTHSGAWTISSATAGIQEAIVATGGRGSIHIPIGFSVIHAPITTNIAVGDISLVGSGMSVSILARSTEYQAGNIIENIGAGTPCGLTVQDLTFYNPGYPTLSPMTSGAAIVYSDQNAETQVIQNVKIIDGWDGILIYGSSKINAQNIEIHNRNAWSSSYAANSGITIGATVSNNSGGNVIENLHTIMDDDDSINGLHYSIRILASDGLQVTNADLKSRIGISLENSSIGITNVAIDNPIIDRVREQGIVLAGSSGPFANIRFTNYHVVGYVVNSAHLTYGIFVTGTNASNVIFSTGIVAGFATAGIGLAAGGERAITINNSQIFANGNGIQWAPGDGGTIVTDNRIYDAGGSVQQYGLYFSGASANNTILGNDLRGNLSVAIQGSTSLTSSIVEHNLGWNPVGVSAITVGASPYTYTAGPSSETVHIYGGTVSDIKRASTTIGTATGRSVELPPFGTVTVTYSVAPTMVKDVH